MATQTFEELIAGANKIKNNELPESNTHNLVGDQLLQMTNKMQEENSNNGKKFSELGKKINELNISVLYPQNGIDGSNQYTLETAISQIPTEFQQAGLRICFVNENNDIESWEYDGISWDIGSFQEVGSRKIRQLNSSILNTFESNNSILDGGYSKIAKTTNLAANEETLTEPMGSLYFYVNYYNKIEENGVLNKIRFKVNYGNNKTTLYAINFETSTYRKLKTFYPQKDTIGVLNEFMDVDLALDNIVVYKGEYIGIDNEMRSTQGGNAFRFTPNAEDNGGLIQTNLSFISSLTINYTYKYNINEGLFNKASIKNIEPLVYAGNAGIVRETILLDSEDNYTKGMPLNTLFFNDYNIVKSDGVLKSIYAKVNVGMQTGVYAYNKEEQTIRLIYSFTYDKGSGWKNIDINKAVYKGEYIAITPSYVSLIDDGIMKTTHVVFNEDDLTIKLAGRVSNSLALTIRVEENCLINRGLLELNNLIDSEEKSNSVTNMTPTYNDILNELDNIHYDETIPSPLREDLYVVEVNSQEDFNNIQSEIESAPNKTIEIVLKGGLYKYKQNHINLSDKSDSKIIILRNRIGESVRIISDGLEYTPDGKENTPTHWIIDRDTLYNQSSVFVDQDGNYVDIFNEAYGQIDNIFYAAGQVEVDDSVTNGKKVPLPKQLETLSLSEEECSTAYMWIATSFQSFYLKINKIENGYIYCTSTNSLNGEFGYVGKIRIKLFGVSDRVSSKYITVYKNKMYIPNSISKLYECVNTKFITLFNTDYDLFVYGIDFIGSGRNTTAKYNPMYEANFPSLIYLAGGYDSVTQQTTFKGRVYVQSCNFTNIASFSCISGNRINGFGITECTFKDLYQGGASFLNCKNGVIKYNLQERIGRDNDNCAGFSLMECFETTMSFNRVVDFPAVAYSGGGAKEATCIIENNECYYTKDYYIHAKEHTLVDLGAIYASQASESTIIRYNYVHNIRGIGNNRGIMLDNTPNNCKVYGNVIMDIRGWTIDFNKINVTGKGDGRGNVCMNNILNGGYHFFGNVETDDTYCGKNLIINQGSTITESIITDCTHIEDDVYENAEYRDGYVFTRNNTANNGTTDCFHIDGIAKHVVHCIREYTND